MAFLPDDFWRNCKIGLPICLVPAALIGVAILTGLLSSKDSLAPVLLSLYALSIIAQITIPTNPGGGNVHYPQARVFYVVFLPMIAFIPVLGWLYFAHLVGAGCRRIVGGS